MTSLKKLNGDYGMSFVATEVPSDDPKCSNYTWTITTRIFHYLEKAQSIYGSRDKAWTILGAEVGPQERPRIRVLPGKYVFIQLRPVELICPTHSIMNLSHEVVHLLGPSAEGPVLNIEEGAAVVFSHQCVVEALKVNINMEDSPYGRAAEDVRTFLGLYPDGIARVRALEPTFARLRPEHFEQFESLDRSLVPRLLTPFPRHQ